MPGREHRARIDPGLQRLLDSWPTTPAHILDHRMNVVAANGLCIGLFAGVGWDLAGESNGARLVFLDPVAREFYLERAEKAELIVTYLRLAAGRHPGDTELSSLVGELAVASPEFAILWAAHRVAEKGPGTMRVRHPMVGVITLLFNGFPVPGDTDLTLVTFTPAAAADEEAIRLLGSWTAPEPSLDERESAVAEGDPAMRRDIGYGSVEQCGCRSVRATPTWSVDSTQPCTMMPRYAALHELAHEYRRCPTVFELHGASPCRDNISTDCYGLRVQ
ncbi:hypothetical protein [Nocardia sp. NPDC050793]|uniref:MmyB family transcriptional regulator n=1 Tax=Nocardia sp. NPDC050793 TaxID=3155159 RepID=UPI0033CEF971